MHKLKKCQHLKTHTESWPDGGVVEVCDACQMSRYLYEQGESPWMSVDIEKERQRLWALIDKLKAHKR